MHQDFHLFPVYFPSEVSNVSKVSGTFAQYRRVIPNRTLLHAANDTGSSLPAVAILFPSGESLPHQFPLGPMFGHVSENDRGLVKPFSKCQGSSN